MASVGDVYLVANMQPHMPGTDAPDYRGTYLNPRQKRRLAEEISTGRRRMPIPLDHAGLTGADDLVPEAERLGWWTDAWVDRHNNLMVVGMLEAHRPETSLLYASMLRRHEYNERRARGTAEETPPPAWGVSMYTPYQVEQETRRAVSHNPTHGGITIAPELAEDGSYILEFGRDRKAFGRMLNARYFSPAAGAFVPRATRERWPSETTTHSEIGRGYETAVAAAASATEGQSHSVLFDLLSGDAEKSINALFRRFSVRRFMADQQQQPAAPAAAAAPTSALPTPIPVNPAPAKEDRQHHNIMYLARARQVLDRRDAADAADAARGLVREMQDEQQKFDIADERFPEILKVVKEMRDLVTGREDMSRAYIGDLVQTGVIDKSHADLFASIGADAATNPELRKLNQLVASATVHGAQRQKAAEKALLEQQALIAEVKKKEEAAAAREKELLAQLAERDATYKRQRDADEAEKNEHKRRYVELQEKVASSLAAPPPVTSPAAAAAKTADAVVAASSGAASSKTALDVEARGIFADPTVAASLQKRLGEMPWGLSATTRFEGIDSSGVQTIKHHIRRLV